MNIEEKVDSITEELYYSFGSDTGVLFGIPPERKSSVRAIVKITVEIMNKSANEE